MSPGRSPHEIGVAFAVLHPANGVDPYRTAEAPAIAVDPNIDLERGSIAAVYLGLGVLAANAALEALLADRARMVGETPRPS